MGAPLGGDSVRFEFLPTLLTVPGSPRMTIFMTNELSKWLELNWIQHFWDPFTYSSLPRVTPFSSTRRMARRTYYRNCHFHVVVNLQKCHMRSAAVLFSNKSEACGRLRELLRSKSLTYRRQMQVWKNVSHLTVSKKWLLLKLLKLIDHQRAVK